MKPKLTIARLDRPHYCGDWHDKPLNWGVYGPGNERQEFNTKADATVYARCRRNAVDFIAAGKAYRATYA